MPTSIVTKKFYDKVIRKRQRASRKWSNLPTELLLKITDDFNLADQVRFRCVCKNWLLLPLVNNGAIYSLLPWLVFDDDDLRELKKKKIYSRLFDFINEKPLLYSEVCSGVETSMHGWVTSLKDRWDGHKTSFIFSCPFSKETVMLPEFQNPRFERRMTISSYPTSKECVFFIVFDDDKGKIKVATYKHGYKNWITSNLHSGISDVSWMIMVFFQGDLYCFDRQQKRLFIYNVAQQFWNNSFHTLETQFYCSKYYLLESALELLLICFSYANQGWVIYTFDAKSLSGWVVKTSLDERALFIGHKLISVPASGEFKHMENKIFYCDRVIQKSKFYNLVDGQSNNCEGTEYQMLARNYGWDD